LNSYKVIIIFVIIKPLNPKLAHAFGYRLSLSASVHSQTWRPVIVTVTKRALLNSSLPVPRTTADKNSNHNHFIVEEDSFTVQFTFSDGNSSSSLSPSISPLFCLQNVVDHTVFYDIWSLKVSKTT